MQAGRRARQGAAEAVSRDALPPLLPGGLPLPHLQAPLSPHLDRLTQDLPLVRSCRERASPLVQSSDQPWMPILAPEPFDLKAAFRLSFKSALSIQTVIN